MEYNKNSVNNDTLNVTPTCITIRSKDHSQWYLVFKKYYSNTFSTNHEDITIEWDDTRDNTHKIIDTAIKYTNKMLNITNLSIRIFSNGTVTLQVDARHCKIGTSRITLVC